MTKGWPVALLLLVLTWAAFGQAVHNGFVGYDDELYLTANPRLAAGPGLDGLRWAFTTTRGGNWHPVTWLSHLADVQLFGMNPAGHHAIGVALHAANALLLFALLRGLTGALWASALAAALFAVHPLRVESVAWAAERKDLLSTLFALGAAVAHLRRVRRGPAGGPGVAAPALFALALMAKPMPLTLPLLLLIFDWWPLGRWSPLARSGARRGAAGWLPPARLFAEKTPLLVLAVASAAVTWGVQAGSGAMRATAHVPFGARAANAVVSYAAYLRKALWPTDLAVLYPYPWNGHPRLVVALAALLLAALAGLAIAQARRRPWLGAGLAWYLVSLLPVIGFVQVGIQSLADRYTYLPLVGAFVAAGWFAAEIARGGRLRASAVAAASVAALVALVAFSDRQVRTWRDEQTLFARALAVTKDNFVALNNLGSVLARQGRPAEALPYFREAVRLAPGASIGYQNVGKALAGLGRHEEALGWYREAIARDPDETLARRNLGLSLEQLGRREEALATYREALRVDPGDPRTLDLAGTALARAGRIAEALPLFEAAAAADPASAAIREHLARARAQLAPGRAGYP